MERNSTEPTARCRRSATEISQILQQCHVSGLTQRQFAQQAGVGYSTLTNWLRRAKRSPLARTTRPQWLPVEVLPGVSRPASGYQIQWPDGTSLQVCPGFATPEVRQLVELLRPCSR